MEWLDAYARHRPLNRYPKVGAGGNLGPLVSESLQLPQPGFFDVDRCGGALRRSGRTTRYLHCRPSGGTPWRGGTIASRMCRRLKRARQSTARRPRERSQLSDCAIPVLEAFYQSGRPPPPPSCTKWCVDQRRFGQWQAAREAVLENFRQAPAMLASASDAKLRRAAGGQNDRMLQARSMSSAVRGRRSSGQIS